MDEKYYWIETISPLFGFWGTAFKLWTETKRIKEKVLHKTGIHYFAFYRKNKIRSPA